MFIEFYIVFALTTAITGVLVLLLPPLNDLANFRPLHNIVEYKVITILTFLCILFVIAPLVIPAVLIPSLGASFRKAFFNELVLELK